MLERINYFKSFIQDMSAYDSKLRKCCLIHFELKQTKTISNVFLPVTICTKKLQSEKLTLTDFYGTWISSKIPTEKITATFAHKLLQYMKNKELHIMNNTVLIFSEFKIITDKNQNRKRNLCGIGTNIFFFLNQYRIRTSKFFS